MNHESYEMMCAEAAIGHLTADELSELSLHVRECEDCRNRLKEFAQLSAQAMPLHGDTYQKPAVPPGMTARFIERIRAEGVSLQAPASILPHPAGGITSLRWGLVAAVLILMGAVSTRWLWTKQTRPVKQEPVVAQIVVNPQPQMHQTDASDTLSSNEIAKLHEQVASDRAEIVGLKQQIAVLQRDLLFASNAREAIASHLSNVEADNSNLRLQASSKDAHLADLDRQLKQEESLATEQIARIVEKQAALDKLSARLSERERELDRQQQLLVASAQARDLITARNLHIIDVHDNDRTGRERPFGRIFYTEGQSLIFYAYDLDAVSGHDTKLTFHVWGGTLGDQKRVKNLGIFRSEDTTAGRWVLTFDDPRVLAQINTVFVTAESANNNLDQPKGKRILFAFLGDQPNHP